MEILLFLFGLSGAIWLGILANEVSISGITLYVHPFIIAIFIIISIFISGFALGVLAARKENSVHKYRSTGDGYQPNKESLDLKDPPY